MEQTENNQPQRRVRRKKSKWQVFKEAYMPVVILALAAILIIVFIVGSISRAGSKPTEPSTDPSSEPTEDPNLAIAQEMAKEAKLLSAMYDYDGALELLATFSGDITQYEELSQLQTQLEAAKASLVAFTDVANVPHLSFANLIADISQTKADAASGSSYLSTYATTAECEPILQALYDKGYVLVSLHDLYRITTDAEGKTLYTTNTLYLPAGKKPLVLSQVHVNYYTFMIGSGFGSRLVLNNDDSISCVLAGSDGTNKTGMYDLVPILDAFIEEHPDFSYHGARATLALTGYQGVLGYRTQADSVSQMGQEEYDKQVNLAKELAAALKDRGYEFACYSYGGGSYASMSASEIKADLEKWQKEVTPILGETDLFFLSMGIDIASTSESYSGEKFQAMKDAGFEVFVGRESSVPAWFQLGENYFRQTRRWVTGENLLSYAQYFTDLFDAASVVDPNR